MIVLGIESSCDETSIAVYSSDKGTLCSKTFSQADIHAAFGGVIPEVASRNHIQKIEPLYHAVIEESSITGMDLDIIGVTNAPGLIGALFVGVSFAKGLGYALHKPVVPVHHLAAHILAAELSYPDLNPPYTALIVSGGHTHIFDVDEALNFTLIGRTIDDAAGEVFDKIAKVMGGPYPGGIFIQNLAEKGDRNVVKFPKAFKGEIKFSFSGLKTAVINTIQKEQFSHEDIAASFQWTVASTLADKTFQAASLFKRDKIVVGGGVAANQEIRRVFNERAGNIKNVSVYFPEPARCTDNGEMIAYTAYRFYKFRNFLNYKGSAYDTKHSIGLL
ncbi:MAG: tRNA (adenosine(37)-N6)-threonylcarbamoyltransferase complex transferase subunit TsaD [Mucispirillum sp.]|nr:tRNA (adenosine(37)-N6)-threonylcarbamoyltransferase complex transferase subunit TsaD [Mucispirillum sp.]